METLKLAVFELIKVRDELVDKMKKAIRTLRTAIWHVYEVILGKFISLVENVQILSRPPTVIVAIENGKGTNAHAPLGYGYLFYRHEKMSKMWRI